MGAAFKTRSAWTGAAEEQTNLRSGTVKSAEDRKRALAEEITLEAGQ